MMELEGQLKRKYDEALFEALHNSRLRYEESAENFRQGKA